MLSNRLIGVFLLLLLVFLGESKKRHHRRSISYDDRWFGFKFDKEPQSGLFDERKSIIPCSFTLSRHRETVVEWRKDSTPMKMSDKRICVESNGSLSIDAISKMDEGVYQCVVHVNDEEGSTWTFLSHKAIMRTKSILRWKNEPKDVSIPLKKIAVFQCSIDNIDDKEEVRIQWMKDGQYINISQTHSILPISNTLLIEEVKKEDEGMYSCIAIKDNDKIESRKGKLSLSRDGEWNELHFISRPLLSYGVIEGQSIILECIPSGEGILRIEWNKDGVNIDENDSSNMKRIGSSLLLSSIRLDDTGTYTCRVFDPNDSIESSSIITVLASPHITSRPSDIIAVETSDVELECYSSGRPSPSLSWYKNGEVLLPSQYFVMDANKLKILGLVKTDQGIYQCFLENEVDNVHAQIQLLVDNTDSSSIAAHSGAPVKSSSPLGLSIGWIGSREATITWDTPLHTNGNILYYHIYYKEEGSDRERVMNSSDHSCRLRNLNPSTTYLIRVAGENEAGIGDISVPIGLTTKEEQEVPGRVVDLRAIAVGSETIEVEWKRPMNEGSIPIRYRLFYVRSHDKDKEKETQINVPSTAYTMHGMDKYTSYDIRVEAEGEKGAGLSSDTVTVRTLSDIPSSAPIDINGMAESTTSIKISWKADENMSNGPITGTRLRYKTKARGSKATNILINEPHTEYIVKDLEVGTSYQMRLAIVNENGTGPFSDWISIDTLLNEKDESILGAPRELRAIASDHYIDVQWKRPADDSVLVRGYQIGWGQNVPDIESDRVESNILQYRINGLKPMKDYIVSVRAFNKQGSGFPIYETVRTIEYDRGHTFGTVSSSMNVDGGNVIDAPLGVEAIAISPTSLRITWPDNPSMFNALYTVKYMSRIDSTIPRYVNTSDTSVIIDKLKPGTEYEVSVRSIIHPSIISSWSMTVSHSTLPAPPSSAPRDLTILPASSGDPHSVTVNWQPPKYANGQMEEYIVYYTDRASAREEEWTSIHVPSDRLSIPIDNLLPKATYYFRIQAKNVKGLGPMSSNQVYSPGSAGFLHPVHANVKPRNNKGPISDLFNQMSQSLLWTCVAISILLLTILSISLLCVCLFRKMKSKKTPTGYNGVRKSSNGMNRNNDLWIQHGVGGASSHLLNDTPSIQDIKNVRNRIDSPSHYHTGSIHRPEDPYASVISRKESSFDCDSSSIRPLLHHSHHSTPSSSTHPLSSSHMVQVVPPAPGSSNGHSDRSGTLSRSYQHSQSSLDQRQRTPQMLYTGHGRGAMAKVEMIESPYGSSLGLGSGTPPPPMVAPPQPPYITNDGYRSIRGTNNMSSGGLRSFSNINPSNGRHIPVGRATAQPRVNVANLCSPYLSSSVMSVEDEKNRLKEEERSDHLSNLGPSLSTDQLNDEVDHIEVDHMISDLQALQQEFGVNS